jgi:hypothetical protein
LLLWQFYRLVFRRAVYDYFDFFVNILQQADFHQDKQNRQTEVNYPFWDIGYSCSYIIAAQSCDK